jgi:hypothetical protein
MKNAPIAHPHRRDIAIKRAIPGVRTTEDPIVRLITTSLEIQTLIVLRCLVATLLFVSINRLE